jgi:hypothetical protein
MFVDADKDVIITEENWKWTCFKDCSLKCGGDVKGPCPFCENNC